MKKLFAGFALLLATPLAAQDIDSTSMLFDDSYVHEFHITFYYPNYEDSLKYWYENGEECIPARIEYEGRVLDSVGVRYKGNSSYNMSRNTPKKPFKFEIDEYIDDLELMGVQTLNFSNATKDPTFMREKICYDIIAQRMAAPRTAYAALYIGGELLGLYTMIEQVDKDFLRRHFPDNDFNLYKASDNGATLKYRGPDQAPYEVEYELKTNKKENDWSRFIGMIEVLNTASDSEFRDIAGAWIEFESAIQLLAFNMVMSNFDSYTGSGRNFYVYDDQTTGRFTFIPWDINEGFGSYTNNWNVFTQDVLTISNLPDRPLNRRVLADEVLRARYLRAIRSLIDGPANEDSVAAQIARWQPLIDSWVQADRNKLYTYQQFLTNIHNDVVIGINMPVPGLTRFSSTRNDNLRAQLAGYAAMDAGPVPSTPALQAWNYPNPVTVNTTIACALEEAGTVQVDVFNALGRRMLHLDAGQLPAGGHAFRGIGEGYLPGVYLYLLRQSTTKGVRIATGAFSVVR